MKVMKDKELSNLKSIAFEFNSNIDILRFRYSINNNLISNNKTLIN